MKSIRRALLLIKIVMPILLFQLNVNFALAQTTSQIKKTIDSLNIELEKAFNNNDMMKVASLYSDDAEISGKGMRVAGRKNVDNYWMGLKDKGRGWKLTVIEVGGYGEWIYQLGVSDLKYISRDKLTRSVTDFLLLWKFEKDGTYKIFRDYLTRTNFKTTGN